MTAREAITEVRRALFDAALITGAIADDKQLPDDVRAQCRVLSAKATRASESVCDLSESLRIPLSIINK